MLKQQHTIKIIYFLFLFISYLLLTGLSRDICKNDDLAMKAIVRSDNDFITYDDKHSERESIPEIVVNKIRLLLDECRKDDYKYDPSSECEYLIFKVRYTDLISIYIAKIYYEQSLKYYFIAYDTKTAKITKEPPWINGGHMENDEEGFSPIAKLMEKPFIFFSSCALKNTKGTIVVKERVHNGTAYNAVINHYYSIDSNMNLNNYLCIESKAIIFAKQRCIINRAFGNNIIESTIKCGNDEPKLLGKVRLEISTNSVQIVSKEMYNNDYEERFLVTVSGVKEESFLKGQRE